ncbi:MAG: ATP-binding protein [Caldilineaceae bacterium]
MRSLAVKLVLAFVLIGITGAVLVALLTAQRTRQEFDRFVISRDYAMVSDAVSDYYAQHGHWEGVGQIMRSNRVMAYHSPRMTIVDQAGLIVFNIDASILGRPYIQNSGTTSVTIDVEGQQVGTVYIDDTKTHAGAPGRFSSENTFLHNVNDATAMSAVIASLIALVVGIVLSRTLMRPVHDLTEATQAVASGQLGAQVKVHAQDEIGRLATSFNQMSTDLAKASQVRKQMTADIAHDLRTPLSILRGYTEGLKDGSLTGAPQLYTIMHEEVTHIQHLVDDLRTLSLADAGELSLNRRAVDPKALLERTGLAYVMQAEQQGLTLRIEAPDELPSVAVDTERMTQVLNNLVANALRFTKQGEIVLAATATEQHVQLEVRDTGVGIAPEELQHIFDRFYRVDKARYRSEAGESGLGLAIAKAIVEAHDGVIAAKSAIGAGAVFTITLDRII